jgi:hypothetical protein
VHRPTSCTVGSGIPSHIPVRSPGHVIKRRGDGQMFKKGHKHATTEFSEANGGVPPKIHLPKPEFASESVDVPSVRGLLFPRFLSRSHASSFQGAMTIYRTRRRLSHGRLRFHHLRSFNHYLPSALPLLLRIPTLMLLRHQP